MIEQETPGMVLFLKNLMEVSRGIRGHHKRCAHTGGRYLGALKTVDAYDLGPLVINEAIRKNGISPAMVDEVVMGQACQSGEYVNIARMSLLTAGWPDEVPGITLDRRCCTGLDVVRYAVMLVQTGQAQIVVAGGVESMSNGEFYLPGKVKWGIGGEKGAPRGHGDLSLWGIVLYDRLQRGRVMSQPEARYGILPSMMSWAETAAATGRSWPASCLRRFPRDRRCCRSFRQGTRREKRPPDRFPRRKSSASGHVPPGRSRALSGEGCE